jgi:hypothetical protein
MARIPYTNKTTAQVSPLPAEQKWTSGDANVVKDSVNAIYDADAATGGEVMFNDGTGVGKSGDLTFDGALQIGANSNAGQIQLGGPDDTAVGTVSSNGTLTMEGEDVVVSGGESVELTTNAVSRLKVDVDGAWLVEGSAGTSNQVLKTNGAGAPPEWGNINTDEVTDNSTIGGGAQDLTTSLDAIADILNNLPAPPVTSVNGDDGDVVLTANDIDITEFVLVTIGGLFTSERFRFITTGQYQRVSDPLWTLVNNNGGFAGWLCSPDGGATPYESNSAKTNPFTDITSWTNPASAVVSGNVVGYAGPTVQDALEQIAAVATKASKPVRSFLNSTSVSYDGTLVFQAVIATGSTSVDVTTIIPGITSCLFLGGYSTEGVQCFAIPNLMDPTQVEVNFFDTAGDPLGDGSEVAVIVAYKL